MKTSQSKTILVSFLILIFYSAHGQVAISTDGTPPDESAILDLISQEQGMLAPRMTQESRDAIDMPANALLIYQTDDTPGFYYNSGTPAAPNWQPIGGETAATKIPISSLPYSISESGSYYLTTSITATSDAGISISTSNVSIDLNGYTLQGDGTSSNNGITSSGPITNIKIHNGFIDDWGGHGINLSSASSIEILNVVSSNNTLSGVYIGSQATVSYCIVNDNGADGISSGVNSIITHNITANNNADGIDVNHNSIVSQCNSYANGDNGIEASDNCKIEQSITNYNISHGISTNTGSDVNNCKCSHNAIGLSAGASSTLQNNQAKSNGGNGIEIMTDSKLTANISDSNGGAGYIVTGTDNTLDNNQGTDNSTYGFDINNSGNIIIRNSASGNTLSGFDITSGNTVAIIITSATINSNSNPYANINF